MQGAPDLWGWRAHAAQDQPPFIEFGQGLVAHCAAGPQVAEQTQFFQELGLVFVHLDSRVVAMIRAHKPVQAVVDAGAAFLVGDTVRPTVLHAR